ncbi:MAG TPA: class I SAM-dependent methyltransferase [Micromonosporaceae bacterium]|jgi:SAM-dependent methyltransferase|nr:class I SAM-dependent methyltransferase [Micromonosporaceae bacterium]
MSDGRVEFLEQRRRICRWRYNNLHADRYDESWGHTPASHAAWLSRYAGMVPSAGRVLDAACGTGRAWPPQLRAGLQVTGIDQSSGMLKVAAAKHPGVPTRELALQDLAAVADWSGHFDGLTCLDAMENVGPEHWPAVVAGFCAVLKPLAPAYLTVEIPDAAETGDLSAPEPADGATLVAGEFYDGTGYHYYPRRDDVIGWLRTAGFELVDEDEADGYWHLLVSKIATPSR